MLIKNVRLINSSEDNDDVTDILIEGDRVIKIAESLSSDGEVLDGSGLFALPGLIDVHVHFRDPGRPELETILGGAKIAARSGYTTVCAMPNTNPPIDSPETIQYVLSEGKKSGINVLTSACVTKGRAGEELADLELLKKAGAVALTDDGSPIMSARIMREALKECARLDLPVMLHEEDRSFASVGVMNEGAVSKELGLPGIPSEAEEIMIARDILLSKQTGAHIHIQHVSSKGSVDIIRQAKAEGIKITAETAPHYFTLTDAAVKKSGTNAAMSPSLRTESDRKAIIKALRDGTIDMIATDHAPHLKKDKDLGFGKAPNGVIGLETALALAITKLAGDEGFSFSDIVRLMSLNPAKLLRIDRGEITEGAIADLVLIDPGRRHTVSEESIVSAYKNCPFIGMELKGHVSSVICAGRIIYSDSCI